MSPESDPRRESGTGDSDRTPGVPPHQPPPGETDTDEVQEEAEESFPSSDPPSTGGPGL